MRQSQILLSHMRVSHKLARGPISMLIWTNKGIWRSAIQLLGRDLEPAAAEPAERRL